MFSKNRRLALSIVLGTVLLFSSALNLAQAQGWGRCMSYNSSWWSPSVSVPEKYQLTPEQMTKIRDIRSEYEENILPLQREFRSLRMEARAYSSRSDAAIGKIRSHRKEITDLEGKIDDLRLEAKAEISKVLTKEQRAYYGESLGRLGGMDDMMDMRDMCPMMADRQMW